jgi:hypothetical protein
VRSVLASDFQCGRRGQDSPGEGDEGDYGDDESLEPKIYVRHRQSPTHEYAQQVRSYPERMDALVVPGDARCRRAVPR